MVLSLRFSLLSPYLLLVALDPIVIHRGSSTMILRLGMGHMRLCLVCLGKHNPREKEGVLVKDCESGGRWVVWIRVAGLGLDT